jgi:hypothetical protein
MHSLNGDWQDCSAEEHSSEEHSSLTVHLSNTDTDNAFQKRSTDLVTPLEGSSEYCSDPNGEGCFEALNLICQSSPILDTRE